MIIMTINAAKMNYFPRQGMYAVHYNVYFCYIVDGDSEIYLEICGLGMLFEDKYGIWHLFELSLTVNHIGILMFVEI